MDSRVWAENFARFGPQVGRGVRLFDPTQVDLRSLETIQGEGAVHLRYAVR